MATLFSLFTLGDAVELGDLLNVECLASAMGLFGVPQLFDVANNQRRTVCLEYDSDGNPLIMLRHGAVITRTVVDELNALIGETYHKGRAVAVTWDDPSPVPPKAP